MNDPRFPGLFPPDPPRATPAPRPERDVYTVSRLNKEVRLLLESGLPLLWLEAELSNFAAPASGHWYFSLKDSQAQVRCAMWRQRNSAVRFRPKDGLSVLVRARVGLYEPRGEYQLIVEHMEEAGEGALKREFEKLKAKLAAEGLFAAERKRALPAVPRRIGVVTSPTGAAIHDILRVLRARFPAAPVLLYPTAVQGAAAVPEIVRAIEAASRRAECDVLIVARGGGSLEDLWCFNDERVARAMARCRIPTVAGVGHEVDVTIADFVADLRAPTPSAAALAVTPDKAAWLESLALLLNRFGGAMGRYLRGQHLQLGGMAQRLQVSHPGARLQQHAQRLDDLELRMRLALRAGVLAQRQRLETLSTRLWRENPRHRLEALCAHAATLRQRLVSLFGARLGSLDQRLALAARTLDAVSPLATLGRGFAVVSRRADGALLRDAADAPAGTEIEARLSKGRLRARVTEQLEDRDD
ncbi:MAG TPA: exodeoxyribonuclease VII large subunit [Steroidobacteraceae bacterium]|nr:exodeoxyribonuclease VII large subunit [Steroidobacteraceae bacterium]